MDETPLKESPNMGVSLKQPLHHRDEDRRLRKDRGMAGYTLYYPLLLGQQSIIPRHPQAYGGDISTSTFVYGLLFRAPTMFSPHWDLQGNVPGSTTGTLIMREKEEWGWGSTTTSTGILEDQVSTRRAKVVIPARALLICRTKYGAV